MECSSRNVQICSFLINHSRNQLCSNLKQNKNLNLQGLGICDFIQKTTVTQSNWKLWLSMVFFKYFFEKASSYFKCERHWQKANQNPLAFVNCQRKIWLKLVIEHRVYLWGIEMTFLISETAARSNVAIPMLVVDQ